MPNSAHDEVLKRLQVLKDLEDSDEIARVAIILEIINNLEKRVEILEGKDEKKKNVSFVEFIGIIKAYWLLFLFSVLLLLFNRDQIIQVLQWLIPALCH